MSKLVTSIVAAAYRRRVVTLLGILAVFASFALAALRVRFDTDVLSLLPRTGVIIPAFRHYVSAFGGVDELFVIFTAPEGQSVEDYDDEINSWASALREAPEIAQVDMGTPDATRNFGWLADRELLLLRDDALEKALDRLSPEGLIKAVASRRELLSLPSPEIAELIRQDPVGLSDVLSEALGPNVRGLSTRLTRGYVSEDGRQRLIIARPTRPPYDSDFTHALDARLTAIRASVQHQGQLDRADHPDALQPVDVVFAGGHRIALETESVVRRESIWNSVSSLALILPLLFVVFRSAWLVLVGPLPSILSLVVVGGVMGLAGVTLSAAAAGSAAMLFGLGVDGVVLLYVSHRLTAWSHETDGRDLRADALGSASSSMLLGMWTTAATFYGLAFVDVPSLQQLGLLIGHSMVACSLLTLLLVPALLPRRPSPKQRPLTMPRHARWIAARRRAILIAAGLATAAAAVSATNLRVDPTLDRLRSVTPAAALEEQIAPIFGLPRDVYILLGRGPSLNALLADDERATGRLTRELPHLSVQPASWLLPSAEAQDAAARRIAAAGLSPDSIRQALERAGDAAGFRPGSFAPFVERLPRLLDSSARVTYQGYVESGLSDLTRRFVARDGDQWLVASFVFPTTAADVTAVSRIVAEEAPRLVLTGLPMVNRELSAMFLTEFAKGLTIGSVVVLLMVGLAFRQWRLCLFALLPTAIGLLWAAGILAALGVNLDLFAVFAVVTFIGVGVDYGIHLVHRFRQHGDPERATAELAPVILAAAAITFAGYGTLFNSSYPPLRSIGIVSGVSVITLAAASVIVLPALLMGRRL